MFSIKTIKYVQILFFRIFCSSVVHNHFTPCYYGSNSPCEAENICKVSGFCKNRLYLQQVFRGGFYGRISRKDVVVVRGKTSIFLGNTVEDY